MVFICVHDFYGTQLNCYKLLSVPPLEQHDGDHSLATKCTSSFLRSIMMERFLLLQDDHQVMHDPE